MKDKISKDGNANAILLPSVGWGGYLESAVSFPGPSTHQIQPSGGQPQGQCETPSTTLGLLSLVISFRSICKELR